MMMHGPANVKFNLLHNVVVIVINYHYMFRPQLTTIFRELASLWPCGADVSTDVAETFNLKHVLESVSVNDKPQLEL